MTTYLHYYEESYGWVYAQDPRCSIRLPQNAYIVECAYLAEGNTVGQATPVDSNGVSVLPTNLIYNIDENLEYLNTKYTLLTHLKDALRNDSGGFYNLAEIANKSGISEKELFFAIHTKTPPPAPDFWWKIVEAICPADFGETLIAKSANGFAISPKFGGTSKQIEITQKNFNLLFADEI